MIFVENKKSPKGLFLFEGLFLQNIEITSYLLFAGVNNPFDTPL